MKRTALQSRTRIRQLRPSESDPEGEPKRYSKGPYTVLRWKVAPYEYVERYDRGPSGSLSRSVPIVAKRLDVDLIIRLYESGLSMPEIGLQVDGDSSQVCRILKKAGVVARHMVDYYPLEVSEVIRLYTEEDLGCIEVAENLNTTATRVLSTLREAGIPIRSVGAPSGPKPYSEGQVVDLIRLYVDERRGIEPTARLVGMSSLRARNILLAEGITLRTPGRQTESPEGPTYETEFRHKRLEVLERSKGFCEARIRGVCHGQGKHVHHRLRRSQNGPNTLANLLTTCYWCHLWLHAHVRLAQSCGLLLRNGDDPALCPVDRVATLMIATQGTKQ